MFNFSYRKVGGIRFLKLGLFTISFSVASRYKKVKPAMPKGRLKLTAIQYKGVYYI